MSSSGRINNLRDPSATQDAATKSYVDSKTTDMATTAYVTGSSWANNPSVTRKDTHNGYVFLAGVGVPGFVSPPVSSEGTGRCNLYMANNLYYVPNSDKLYAGTFSGAISGTTGAFSGYVGIGLTSPDYPLHITGFKSNSFSGNWSVQNGQNNQVAVNSARSVSIYSAGDILLAGFLVFNSDKRIKKNVKDIDGSTALSQIRQIRPKIYNYIDYNTKGNGNVYGFIAQDVKDVILHSTMCTKEYIPNFYCQGNICVIDASNHIYEISSENDLYFEKVIDDSGNEVLFHKVKIYAYDSSDYICSVIQVNNPKNIRVKLEKEYKFANNEENKYKLFIYGQQIYDFHSLENNSVWTVATAALQEVDRQQQADKIRIAELEATVANQQSLINDILERLKTLEKV